MRNIIKEIVIKYYTNTYCVLFFVLDINSSVTPTLEILQHVLQIRKTEKSLLECKDIEPPRTATTTIPAKSKPAKIDYGMQI